MIDAEFEEKLPQLDLQIAMWAHLVGLLSCIDSLWGLLAVIIFYFVNRGSSPFIRHHTVLSLNFQLTYFLATLIFNTLVARVVWGIWEHWALSFSEANSYGLRKFPHFNSLINASSLLSLVGILLFIFYLLGCIKAATHAFKGETWHNLFAIRFMKYK